MDFETKEQVLEKILAQEKSRCPHCNTEMNIWEVPPFNFSDGLGWGAPYLFVCFNDECSVYVKGWENIQENYAHNASVRCMCYPGKKSFQYIPVFSPMGAKGQIIDDQILADQKILKERIKKGFSTLTDAYLSKDSDTVVKILLDATEPQRVRLKAAEIIGDIGKIEVIEPIRNTKLGNEIMKKQVDESVEKIHTRYFTKECPLCAEIIKKRAKICKHCQQEVAGL